MWRENCQDLLMDSRWERREGEKWGMLLKCGEPNLCWECWMHHLGPGGGVQHSLVNTVRAYWHRVEFRSPGFRGKVEAGDEAVKVINLNKHHKRRWVPPKKWQIGERRSNWGQRKPLILWPQSGAWGFGVGGSEEEKNESMWCHGNQERGASQEDSWVLQQG